MRCHFQNEKGIKEKHISLSSLFVVVEGKMLKENMALQRQGERSQGEIEYENEKVNSYVHQKKKCNFL